MKTYYEIIILDSCGDIYDSISHDRLGYEFSSVRECGKRIVEMKEHDKELGEEFGTWDYRIVKHEEDDNNDYQSFYKVYKYKGIWKVKRDIKFENYIFGGLR